MKKLIVILLIISLVIGIIIGGLVKGFLYFTQEDKPATSPGEFQLPEVSLSTLEEDTIEFNSLQQPTVLLFLIPQSQTCQLQLDILTEIHSHYNLKIITVGIGALEREKLAALKREKGLPFPVVIDRRTELTEKLEISTIPSLVFYQPQSEPKTIIGFQSKTDLKSEIKEYFLTKSE